MPSHNDVYTFLQVVPTVRHNKESELRHMSHNNNHVFHRTKAIIPKHTIRSRVPEIITLSIPELHTRLQKTNKETLNPYYVNFPH